MDKSDLAFLDDILLPTSQLEPEPMQSIEPELTFRDPFVKRQSVQLELPNLPALEHFVGGDSMHATSFPDQRPTSEQYFEKTRTPMPQKFKDSRVDSYESMRINLGMPVSHCCYTLAYSTLESLSVVGSDPTNAYLNMESKSLDNVLSIARIAVQSVQQLLSCSCSSDPHLAMLYSSITSKLLTWYRVAAGANDTASRSATPSLNNTPVSMFSSSSGFSSPMSPHNMGLQMNHTGSQPAHFGVYQHEAAELHRLRKQAVLHEVHSCGQLIETLANWRGDGTSEQGKFLYDVLGTWLRSELNNTIREVEGA